MISRPEIGTRSAVKNSTREEKEIGAARQHRSGPPSPRGEWWTSTSLMRVFLEEEDELDAG